MSRSKSRRNRWIVGIVVIAILIGAGGYYFYSTSLDTTVQADEPELQTSTVRQGELVVSATGAGSVIAGSNVNLGFLTSGLLEELAVQVGDKVLAGDVLGQLDETEATAQLLQSQIALRQAELQLQDLLSDPDTAAMASAQAALVSANADLTQLLAPAGNQDLAAATQNLRSAQQMLNALLAGPSSQEVASAKAELELAGIAVQQAQSEYDKVSWRSNIGELAQARTLQETTIAYEKAQASYDLANAGADADQISAARAQVASAQSALNTLRQGPDAEDIAAAEAQVEQARAELDKLLSGASSIEVELAQLNVEQAQNNLITAQNELEKTTLYAPSGGVITSLDAAAGEMVSTSPILVLADLEQPLLEIFLDETDLDKVGIGYEVEVVFDAFPDDTFTGTVQQIDPSLTSESGSSAVKALVRLDRSSFSKPLVLPIGLNATVEVIGGRAENAMLIPVEALREVTPGQYAVFVMRNGEPELTFVEVGLMDFTFAEIISGLEQGDVVTTGIVATQ